jgi:glycosyltransferase involved in cell wall biosynthesis
MNTLIVNYEYPPVGAGAANASRCLAQALARQGHGVAVLTAAYENLRGYRCEHGVHVYRVPAFRKYAASSGTLEKLCFAAAGCLRAAAVARKHRITHGVIFFTVPCGPIGYWLKRRLGIPYLISLRGGDVPGLVPELDTLHTLIAPLRRMVLRSAAAIVANDRGLAALSRQADPFPVCVIPNGVDATYFHPNGRRAAGLSDNVMQFLFVGRFHPQKNLHVLLDAFAQLQSAARRPCRLHLAGDGPQRADLQQYARRKGLAECTVWHGWLPKNSLRSLYQSADCLVNPSLYEGMPNVVLEAMACGLPVVASTIPGHDTIVRHGTTGLLFDPGTPGALASALRSIIDDCGAARAMGHNGRETALASFSWDSVASRYVSLQQGARGHAV